MGIRDVNVFALYGTRKNAGDVSAPFFPTNGALMLAAAMGYDGGSAGTGLLTGYGVVAGPSATTSNANTLSGSTSVGATSVTLTSASGYVQNGYIQIDVNVAGGTTAEVRKITNVSSNTLTLDSALNFAHASGVATKFISATNPSFTHTLLSGNNLPSMTIEKNIGGYQSLVFTGSRVGKYGLKLAAGETPAEFSASIISKGVSIYNANTTPVSITGASINTTTAIATYAVSSHSFVPGDFVTVSGSTGTGTGFNVTGAVLTTTNTTFTMSNTNTTNVTYVSGASAVSKAPSAVSVVNESPFVFAEATVTLQFVGGNSNIVAQVVSIGIDIENGLKPTYTFNNSHDLQFLTPVSRKVAGQMEVVFTSLDDADWGYYSQMQNQVQGSLSISLTHPTNPGYGMTISLPQINIAKYADGLKLEDVVMSTLDFEASYALGNAIPSTITATITNGQWLPY
jgi:hypothetical protein